MDSFEWNKIAGAALFALLVAVGLNIFSEIVFETEAPETPGYVIALAEQGEVEGEAAAEEPIAALLASADAGAGEAAARKCIACHTFAEGEANKVGPNLWNVVMQPIAAHEGYEYSDAMRGYAGEAETWTYEHLNTFLTAPTSAVPGTKMVFPGLKDATERANVIAYLRSLSDSPAPLPEPQVASTEDGAGVPAAAEEPAAEGAAEGESAEAADASEPAEETAESEQVEEPAPEQETAQAEPAEETAGAEAPAEEQASEQEVAQAEASESPSEEAAATEEQPAEQEVAQAGEGEEPATEEAAAEMPAGDAARGEVFAKRCIACHSFDDGGPNKVGPPLFGVFGRAVAAAPDYQYSDAMSAFSEDGSKLWDAGTLDTYLADPRGVVPGTKMIFPGLRSEADRANVIAYLATLK